MSVQVPERPFFLHSMPGLFTSSLVSLTRPKPTLTSVAFFSACSSFSWASFTDSEYFSTSSSVPFSFFWRACCSSSSCRRGVIDQPGLGQGPEARKAGLGRVCVCVSLGELVLEDTWRLLWEKGKRKDSPVAVLGGLGGESDKPNGARTYF